MRRSVGGLVPRRRVNPPRSHVLPQDLRPRELRAHALRDEPLHPAGLLLGEAPVVRLAAVRRILARRRRRIRPVFATTPRSGGSGGCGGFSKKSLREAILP